MSQEQEVVQERVDSLPVVIEMGKRLGLVEVLDECLGSHGNHQGLSYGELALGWLAYILAENDHRKSIVEGWADRKRHVLSWSLGSKVRRGEFNDDRLGRLLERLGDLKRWAAIEERLWQHSAMVFDLDCESIRLDSTTSCGYHTTDDEGLMQLGHSKDRRPDLPQLKLMAAVAEPAGQLIASEVHPGNEADDGLYMPMVERARAIVGTGKLYTGDAKMAALSIRAAITEGGDHYLTKLPRPDSPAQRKKLIDEALAADTDLDVIGDSQSPWGVGYTTTRTMKASGTSWTEWVHIYQPAELFARRSADLDRRLEAATKDLLALSPDPGPGRRQLASIDDYSRAIDRIRKKDRVEGLLMPVWTRKPWPSRQDPDRIRIVIPRVQRHDDRIEERRQRLGWHVLVSSLPASELSLESAVPTYNGAWRIELQFRDLKGRPLGIRPLYVTTNEQIRGLTHLLTLGLRMLTLITTSARRSLKNAGESLTGLYEGQKSRTTDRPTARRLLRAFHRHELNLVLIRGPAQNLTHVSPLPEPLQLILHHLRLPDDLFTRLADAHAY